MTDFQNSFTVTLSRRFAIKTSLQILPHLNGVATLPCERLMSDNIACPICWDTGFLKYKLARDITYDSQQLLWQKQVTIIGSINLGSHINEYRTGVARFQHAVSPSLCAKTAFCSDSLFFVAPDAISRSFCEFFSVANVNSFFIDETNKDNITQQLFWAEESCMEICFNQLSRRHLFKHFNPRSQW